MYARGQDAADHDSRGSIFFFFRVAGFADQGFWLVQSHWQTGVKEVRKALKRSHASFHPGSEDSRFCRLWWWSCGVGGWANRSCCAIWSGGHSQPPCSNPCWSECFDYTKSGQYVQCPLFQLNFDCFHLFPLAQSDEFVAPLSKARVTWFPKQSCKLQHVSLPVSLLENLRAAQGIWTDGQRIHRYLSAKQCRVCLPHIIGLINISSQWPCLQNFRASWQSGNCQMECCPHFIWQVLLSQSKSKRGNPNARDWKILHTVYI